MNRVVLVTGSSRGIGANLVVNFAQKGYKTIINYSKSNEEAESLHHQLSATAGRDNVLLIKADVSNRKEVRDMFDRIIGDFGEVDVLINNAGINIDGPFLEMTDMQWQQVIDTNLTGTFICSQEFALHLSGKSGDIINVGASTAIRGRKNGCNYCSAKAGIITLTKCLALELAPRIRVNCIIPGYIDTEEVMTRYNLYDNEKLGNMVHSIPMGRLGTPDDIFKAAEFLVENASYITGQNFLVNGGIFMY